MTIKISFKTLQIGNDVSFSLDFKSHKNLSELNKIKLLKFIFSICMRVCIVLNASAVKPFLFTVRLERSVCLLYSSYF